MVSPPVPVLRLFRPVRFPRRDDPDHGVVCAKTMADDKRPQLETDAKHQKPVLGRRMIGIIEPDGVLIQEDRLRFLEGDAVLTLVGPALWSVPLETNLIHMYIVRFPERNVKP